MKNYITLIVLLLLAVTSVAQTESYVAMLNVFQKHFNGQKGATIYQMMNPQMQQALSEEQVISIVKMLNYNLGTMESFEYVEKKGRTEIYEGRFKEGNQYIAISLDEEGMLSGLRFLPVPEAEKKATMDRNVTPLALPFKGTWFTFWGGDTKEQNYHVVSQPQKHAFDFLIIGQYNRTYRRSGTRNEDYYAFGKPIYAVCDATVFRVETGIPDNKPGTMNAAQPLGNSVVLKTEANEYIVYAHFEEGTVKVVEGQQVTKGQLLGRCGNSGNSSEPHLHLHIQDGPNMMTSVGVKCYFESLLVNGTQKTDYSPVRLDVIAPVEN
ncbi:M23 family metallopeptidase [Altibacter sp. HG106]|uniref:M23 family metallopeptidase n=1 Tax=Altibacter sp. HG106 TaxID=3023937 RepID=UPI0023502817|nr:M23 family metallopeptidase [Altibacter sp. HG106]MDC7995565.1 peptidoglycan DD-metalloendopeptidase family protein [Altibacter sp. HG106]